MSADTNAPSPHLPPMFGRFDYALFTLLGCAVVGAIIWGLLGAPTSWDFSNSVVVEGRSESRNGEWAEYGRIYSQAQVDLPPGTDLILPISRRERTTYPDPVITVDVRNDGALGVVRILTETSIGFRPSGTPFRLRDAGRGTRVWKRRLGPVLILDVSPGSKHWEAGGKDVRATFIVPPGQKVRQEPPSAAQFSLAYRADERGIWWPVSIAEAEAAGWQQVLLSPLSRKQFR